MKVYKYRGLGKNFDRDLNSIVENYFYAPNAERLNDPCETLVFSDKIKSQSNIFVKLFGNRTKDSLYKFHESIDDFISNKRKLGIYSLSKTYDDELLWAHYANNHTGFCIEYDFDILMNGNSFCNFYSFPVEYTSKPPQIEVNDLSSNDNKVLLKKIAGTKSKRWLHEKEIRVITDKFGEQDYDCRAVKSIYFGYRMPDDNKDEIMKRLSGRSINYFQIHLDEKSYSFYRKKIKDKYEDVRKYLFEYYRNEPPLISQPLIVKYDILERKYQLPYNKGILSIQLESKLTKSELN